MTDTASKSADKNTPEKAKSDEKQARLSQALRANLRRRKDQARVRKQPED